MLKPCFKTLEEEETNFKTIMKREKSLRDKLEVLFPKDIDATLMFSPSGTYSIYAFISLHTGVSKEDTERCRHFLINIFGKAKRQFREEDGTFQWVGRGMVEDGNNKYEEIVFIENTHPGNCKITQVKKMVTAYKTDCKPEG